MARRKRPDGETQDQAEMRRKLELVADAATRSEKVSWDRKMDNMVSLIAKLRPIEDQILDLMALKTPIIDEIAELRREMVRECVHPYQMLAELSDGSTRCKFCDKRFVVQDGCRKKT